MFVPADKAANNIIVVRKRYYIEVICKELGLWPGTTSSDTYIPETMDPKEISGNHISCMKSLRFKEDNLSDKFLDFYCIPKLHKTPYKHRFIASSFDCTTKPLSVLLTRILSAIKRKLSNLSSVIYSRTGINEMWILKNSSELLQKMNDNFSSRHSMLAERLFNQTARKLMRTFYKFMSRYPELASKFSKSPSSMICDSVPMAQLYHTL